MLGSSCFTFTFSQIGIFINSELVTAGQNSAAEDRLPESALGLQWPLTRGRGSFNFMPESPRLKCEGH